MNETAETLERALKNATNTIDSWQQRVEAAETETAVLRERIAERDAELTMLREALDTIPLHEYGDAQREGCDGKGAWDCFKEALTEHVAAVRSVTAVYDNARDIEAEIADLRQQLQVTLIGVRRYIETGSWGHLMDLLPEEEGWRER